MMDIYLAKWINKPSENPGQAYWFRKMFDLGRIPKSTKLYFSGAGFYELYINGQMPDPERVLRPAPSQFDRHINYTVYDVAPLLKPGKNVMAVLLGNGFYNCWEKDYANLDNAPYRDFPKFMTYLLCDNELILCSDGTWKVHTSGVVYNSVRRGEFFDARLEPENIFDTTMDDSDWDTAQYCNPPGGSMLPEQGHPCRIVKRIDPISEKYFTFGKTVYDFGYGMAGWCEVTFSAPKGVTLILEYGEMLRDNGDLDREYNHSHANTPVFEEDRFTAGEAGRLDRIHARFTWHGFRYVRVRAEHPDIKIEKIQACQIHNDFPAVGDFSSSNPVLNRLLELTRNSLKSNFVGIPTDCPHREKAGWTGDVQLSCNTGLFLYDMVEDYAHFLQCVVDGQRVNGQITCVAPSGSWGYNWGSGPAWDMVMFSLPYEIYRFTGERKYIDRYYDNMKRYLDFCRQMARGNLLYWGLGDWCPVEQFRLTPTVITSTACGYDMLNKMVFFASLLEKNNDVDYYSNLAVQVRKAFNREFYHGDGSYGDDSWTSLGCALYFDLVDNNERCKVAERLVQKVRANQHKVDFGILGAKYVPHALAREGYADDALQLFIQQEYPGWGYWVKAGATTLWETWSGLWSRNHIMFGDPPNWCFEHLGGLVYDQGKLIWAPKAVPSLEHFQCSRKTNKGEIISKWRRIGEVLEYSLILPKGTSCLVRIPGIPEENLLGPVEKTYLI